VAERFPDPELAAYVDRLRQTLTVDAGPTPPRVDALKAKLRFRLAAFRLLRRARWPAAAVVAGVSALLLLVPAQPGFVGEAISAHRLYANDPVQPVEIDADRREQLMVWLSRRLGEPVGAPTLEAIGLKLLGGRLVPNAEEPAAQFTYEDRSGGRITLFVARDDDNDASEIAVDEDDEDVAVAYWSDGRFAYAIVARAPETARRAADVALATYRGRGPRRR
jgi:anti-sigma factor RsiW